MTGRPYTEVPMNGPFAFWRSALRPRPWLMPLGALYGVGSALRVGLYRRGILHQARLAGPVISVGNLRVGGSGKTPVVARLAEILRDAGFPVSILSRGYGGSFTGDALVVGDGKDVLAPASAAGDEPVMLARSLPGVVVAVGPRRHRVGREVERLFGRRVHILDDGFQHLRLARDLDLVCVTTEDLRDRPLPAGYLREFKGAASRAHIILWTDGATPCSRVDATRNESAHVVTRRVEGFFDREGLPKAPPRHPFLLAGIARPERFASDVASRVEAVAGRAFFRDHHVFQAQELETIAVEARQLGADALVTTAKDAVRIHSGALALPLLILRVSAVIEDEDRLRERLVSVARRAL